MGKELEALDRIFNGMSNNVGYIKYFETIRQALVELEDLRESNKEIRKYYNSDILKDLDKPHLITISKKGYGVISALSTYLENNKNVMNTDDYKALYDIIKDFEKGGNNNGFR